MNICEPVPDSPTAGVQEAIDAIASRGGVVQLAGGDFMLRRSIMMRSGVSLRGAGAATVLRCVEPYVTPLAETTDDDPQQCLLTDVGPFQVGDQIWVSEVYISGRRNHFGNRSRHMLVTQIHGDQIHGKPVCAPTESFNYRVEEGAFAARLFPAIFVLGAHDVTVADLSIDGGFDAPFMSDGRQVRSFVTAAVRHRNSRRTRLTDLTVRRWHSDGICAGGAEGDVTVTGCTVEDCHGYGLHTGGAIKSAQWCRNISRRNQHGFLFCQQNRNVVCSDNIFSFNDACGIRGLDKSDRYCVIANNICHDNGECGIDAKGSIGNVIQGNLCRNNSRKAAGEYPGILLENHRDNLVTGNLCVDDQATPTQIHGVVQRNPIGENLVEQNSHRCIGSDEAVENVKTSG